MHILSETTYAYVDPSLKTIIIKTYPSGHEVTLTIPEVQALLQLPPFFKENERDSTQEKEL